MANRVIISKIMPLQFYLEAPPEDPQYISKHLDDWWFSETILPWQQKTCYKQPVHKADLLSMQLQSSVGPINLKLYRMDGGLADTIPFQQLQQNVNDLTMFIYEVDVDMSIYPANDYYFMISFGSPEVLSLVSETIKLSEKIENTVLLEYEHYKHYQDVIFETGYLGAMRAPAILKYETPDGIDVLFEDQDSDSEMLESVPFDIWQLRIGLAAGIPDYLARKINRLSRCSSFRIDGKYFTRIEGQKMDRLAQKDYPMSAWTVDLREQINRSSRIYENGEAQEGFLAVMVTADSKGFGTDNGGNETIITDVE